MIEHELFDLEIFRNRPEFSANVRAYQRWWNFTRPYYSKGKTPVRILKEQGVDPQVLLLDSRDLDAHMP